MTKPKVLVTGASGLIGGLVLANLADRYEFSGLSRHAVPGIPYTVGSITDRDAVRRAVAGQDMVLHLAGETQSLEWDEQFEVTAGGTINVLRAAAAAGRPALRADEHRQHDVRLGMGREPALWPPGRRRSGLSRAGTCSTTRPRPVPTARMAPPSSSARRPHAGSPTRRR